MSKSTLTVCADYLVNGTKQKDICQKYGVTEGEISRGVKRLTEAREKILAQSIEFNAGDILAQQSVVLAAKMVEGEGLSVSDAEPGQTYEGSVILNSKGFMIQKTGRSSAVLHDAGKLDKMPAARDYVKIEYLNEGKAAVSYPREVGLEKGGAER